MTLKAMYLVKNIRESRCVRQAYLRKAVFLTQNLNWEGASEVQPSSNIPALFFGFFFFLKGYGLKKNCLNKFDLLIRGRSWIIQLPYV